MVATQASAMKPRKGAVVWANNGPIERASAGAKRPRRAGGIRTVWSALFLGTPRGASRRTAPGKRLRVELRGGVSARWLAAAATTLGVDLAGRLDHGVQPLTQLFVAECSVEVELRSKRFQDGAHADTLLCSESMPMVVRVVAHVGVEGFPTFVI